MTITTLKVSPILIEHREGSKFWFLDDWTDTNPPNRKDIQQKYGAGVYRLTDSSKDPVVVKWEIGEAVKPNPSYQRQTAPPAGPSVQEQIAQAMRSYAPPAYTPPPQPVVAGSGAVSAALNELRLSIHAISARIQNAEHQTSTIVYELKQLPDRISDRVRDVVSTMADPEERLLSIADIADRIQSGRVAPESEGMDWASLIGGAVQALGARGQAGAPSPEQMAQLAQLQAAQGVPPAPQMPQPMPQAYAPAPMFAAPQPAAPVMHAPPIPGLTAAKAQEIAAKSAELGFSYEQAIQLAVHQGLTADQLLELGDGYIEDEEFEDEEYEIPEVQPQQAKGANGESKKRSGPGPEPSPEGGGAGSSTVG